MFEAQAQAQFIIHKLPEELTVYEYLLVLDFGGHSMGGSHGELRWVSAERPRILSPPQSDFGARGGYEQWEIQIGYLLDEERKSRQQGSASFSDKQWRLVRAALLKDFFLKKEDIQNEDGCYLHANLKEVLGLSERNQYIMSLTGDQLNQTWERAFRDVVNMAKENIGRVAQNKKDILVLLSGGSSENIKVKEEINDYCEQFKDHDLPINVDFRHVSDDYEVVLLKWMIAEGGASCLAATMEVEEFFDLGGVFAIQTSKDGHWDDHANLLLCKVRGASCTQPKAVSLISHNILSCRMQMASSYTT